MSINNPSKLEVWLYLHLGGRLQRAAYQRYIYGLPLRGDEHVLDFGSGPGIEAGMLAKRLWPGRGRVTCLDISAGWQAVARRELAGHANVDFILGDITQLHLHAASYHAIVCHLVLHHVEPGQRAGVVAEWARVVRTGGRLYLREPVGGHGIRVEETSALLAQAGWVEERRHMGSILFMGRTFEGIYHRG